MTRAKSQLDSSNVATGLVVIFALVGGALVILSAVLHVDPALRLSFEDYLQAMTVGVGLLAVGRGIKAHGTGR